jgi:hypothetical protein
LLYFGNFVYAQISVPFREAVGEVPNLERNISQKSLKLFWHLRLVGQGRTYTRKYRMVILDEEMRVEDENTYS